MLAKWNPFDFEKFFVGSFWPEEVKQPRSDFYEDKDKFILEAEVPGMGPDDIEIILDKGILTIKGKSITEKSNERKYHRIERVCRSFQRSFSLPKTIETESVQASYDKGILTIHILKPPTEEPKKIKIKSTG